MGNSPFRNRMRLHPYSEVSPTKINRTLVYSQGSVHRIAGSKYFPFARSWFIVDNVCDPVHTCLEGFYLATILVGRNATEQHRIHFWLSEQSGPRSGRVYVSERLWPTLLSICAETNLQLAVKVGDQESPRFGRVLWPLKTNSPPPFLLLQLPPHQESEWDKSNFELLDRIPVCIFSPCSTYVGVVSFISHWNSHYLKLPVTHNIRHSPHLTAVPHPHQTLR